MKKLFKNNYLFWQFICLLFIIAGCVGTFLCQGHLILQTVCSVITLVSFIIFVILDIKDRRTIPTINIVLDDEAEMPTKAHMYDAGYDLYCTETFEVPPHAAYITDTGVHIEIPQGYVGMIKSKSGLNVKEGVQCEGVIDSGYTGSIVVKAYNHSDKPKKFEKHDKLTQLVIMPVGIFNLNPTDSLTDTERGDNGFGSSGK